MWYRMKFKRSSLTYQKFPLPDSWDYALRTQIGRYGKNNTDALRWDRIRENETLFQSPLT